MIYSFSLIEFSFRQSGINANHLGFELALLQNTLNIYDSVLFRTLTKNYNRIHKSPTNTFRINHLFKL